MRQDIQPWLHAACGLRLLESGDQIRERAAVGRAARAARVCARLALMSP